jgi:hypothetical protein
MNDFTFTLIQCTASPVSLVPSYDMLVLVQVPLPLILKLQFSLLLCFILMNLLSPEFCRSGGQSRNSGSVISDALLALELVHANPRGCP